MGSKKAKASAVSDTHDSSTKPGIGARVDTPDTNQLSEKEKALVRVEWLKALAGQLLQEASELEAKWGSADAKDAMNLDDPADSAGVATGATDAASDEPVNPLKKKKAKKNKKKAVDIESDTMDAEATQHKTPSAPSQAADGRDAETLGVKSKKDKKRKRQGPNEDNQAEAGGAGAHVVSSSLAQVAAPEQHQEEKASKKAKESKKMKKANKGKDDKAAQDTDSAGAVSKNHNPGSANSADNWNVNALDGGLKRQNKFMKLLGGGKVASSPATHDSDKARPKYDVHKYQDDLQKQYDAGMRLKFEGQGQRRGLGA